MDQLRADLREKVITPVVPANLLDDKTVYHLQPSGMFVIGGPQGKKNASREPLDREPLDLGNYPSPGYVPWS